MAKGSIGVTTSNIFPVIKQFLYSDHEIFLREIVSNAVDATQKLKTLANAGEFKGKTDDLKVSVKLDTEAGTLTVSDNGIGMTAEEIDKYINQIAFSGAEDFLNKFKDNANAIIGHFGLGFYSAFMVSKKVEIRTLSYKEGAKAMKWTCDGSPEYDMEECEKAERGTDIVMYIDDEEKEYLEKNRISALLNKYCRFMPVPVIFGKEQEWKDGKYVDTDTDKVINNIEPLWTRTPTELKDEDHARMGAQAVGAERRGLQEILSRALPDERGAAFLDSSERGLSLQADRYPLFPSHQKQPRPASQQDPALLQPGVRNRQRGRRCARLHDAASRCYRFSRYSSERIS